MKRFGIHIIQRFTILIGLWGLGTSIVSAQTLSQYTPLVAKVSVHEVGATMPVLVTSGHTPHGLFRPSHSLIVNPIDVELLREQQMVYTKGIYTTAHASHKSMLHTTSSLQRGLVQTNGTLSVVAIQEAASMGTYSDGSLTPVVRRGRGDHGVPGGVVDPTVPVGDGMWILVLACLGYAIVRWRKRRKCLTLINIR